MAEPSIKDLAYRTAASVFGGPVDLATMVMRPFGYNTPDTQVMGGSEWIGKKMEEAGLVSSARAPLTEFIASVAVPTPGGLAKGAALAAPALGGIFVGKGAKTWDALAAQKAKIMADMGTDPRTIWKETGTWKGPDGKWRQEIDDRPATAQFTHLQESGTKQLAERALEHPEAFKAYPNLSEVPHLGLRENTPRGSTETLGSLTMMKSIGPSEKSLKSTALHETQHVIQKQEGFAQGGNVNEFLDVANQIQKMAKRELPKIEGQLLTLQPGTTAYERLLQKKNDLMQTSQLNKDDLYDMAFRQYRQLAGEAEARAVQKRMNMTPEQRRTTFPEESYDVPINQLMIRDVD
jgi:hypothetical protein